MATGNKLSPGTMFCPDDRERLHFEMLGGMRLKHQVGNTNDYIYKACCPKCGKHFDVQAPRESV